jgi:8-oxo-dGTP pyrophosphatase MutT (NUDIX family)
MQTFVIGIGVVKYEDKLLLLKRPSDAKQSPNEWEFVSGSFDVFESAEELVLRECLEEAGLKGEIEATGTLFEYMDKDIRWIIIPYLLSVNFDVVKLSDEHTEHIWVDMEEIQQYDELNGDNYLETVLKHL